MTTQIPDIEIEVLVCYGFDVEPDCRDCRYDLADLKSVLAFPLADGPICHVCGHSQDLEHESGRL